MAKNRIRREALCDGPRLPAPFFASPSEKVITGSCGAPGGKETYHSSKIQVTSAIVHAASNGEAGSMAATSRRAGWGGVQAEERLHKELRLDRVVVF